MTRSSWTMFSTALVLGSSLMTGCAGWRGGSSCETCEVTSCDVCQTGCETCETCDTCEGGGSSWWGGSGGRGWGYSWSTANARFWSRFRNHAIPEVLPLGVVVRSHYQAMETNAEAVDFILYDRDFVLETAELTSDGKDKILEISARMRSAPFPVLVERSENNSNPELDSYRRDLVAQILTDLGNPDGQQRTIVATPYGPGYNSIESERDWYQHIGGGGNNNNFGNNGFGSGANGGFGGGGGAGGGFF
ncbi:MAG TPA: hypothetical protein DD473_01645 [Planctomycetaceae bacterium]|nr:hypothetical protein [Planctomycetaceae bacterium]